jgi:hypothetical protein
MAGKNDKSAGVFVISCSFPKRVYIGKSKSVGMALRSAKSKLGKGKFHNKEMQLQYDKTPNSFTFHDLDLLDSEENEDIKGIAKLFEIVKDEWLKEGYMAYNDITVVEVKVKDEIDVYGIDDLDNKGRNIILRILEKFEDEEMNFDALSAHLQNVGI